MTKLTSDQDPRVEPSIDITDGERNFGGRHFNARVESAHRRRVFTATVLVVVLIIAAVVATPGLRSNIAALAALEHPEGQSGVWRLAFDDQFSQSKLASHWNTCYPNAQANGCSNSPEQQWYQTQNIAVNNGMLNLTARKENANGFGYTSGMVTTGPLTKNNGDANKFDFKYGYLEARVKVPKGQGLWPALWMLPSTGGGPPEIDALEVLGNDTKTSYASLHWSQDEANKSLSTIHSTDFADGFHTVGVRWSKNAIEWFFDGVSVKKFVGTEQIPHTKMYVLANLAVGGEWPGPPNNQTQFPADYQIDWIKVWKPITG